MLPLKSWFLSHKKRFLKASSTSIIPPPPSSLSTLAKAPLLENSSSFSVQFLTQSCGLPFQSAISVSRKLRFDQNNIKNPQSVLHFLKSHQFDDIQIGSLIKKCPNFLQCCVEKNLRPKFDFLLAKGFDERVPLDRVSKLIVNHPITLLRRHDTVVDAVNALKNMGLEPRDTKFVRAVDVRIQMNDTTWKKKIEVMTSLGWSEEKTLQAFKRYPYILASSEKKIKRGMDFFLNVVESGQELVFSYPYLLHLSVDKRLRSKYDFIKN